MSDSSATLFRIAVLSIGASIASTSPAAGQLYEVYDAPDCAIDTTAWLPIMPNDCASCCVAPGDCCQSAVPMVACTAMPIVDGCSSVPITAAYPAVAPTIVVAPGTAVAPPGQLVQPPGQVAQPAGPGGSVQPGQAGGLPPVDKPALPPDEMQPEDPNGEPIMIDPDKEIDRPAASGSEKTVVDRTTRLVPVTPRRQANLTSGWRQVRR